MGILFDQNVKRAQAIFVPWFGKLAATTGAVALAAYRLKAPVTVLALVHLGSDRYKYIVRPIDLKTIYESDLDKEQAHKKITEIVSNCYVELIRQYPEQWFWMHRRWRTRPEGEKIIY